jgi:hypothetical protein
MVFHILLHLAFLAPIGEIGSANPASGYHGNMPMKTLY